MQFLFINSYYAPKMMTKLEKWYDWIIESISSLKRVIYVICIDITESCLFMKTSPLEQKLVKKSYSLGFFSVSKNGNETQLKHLGSATKF